MRLINAVAEYNAEHGTHLRTIALYTEPDQRAMFVREADESYNLGPAHYTDDQGTRKVAYVNYRALEEALEATKADAVWVGWGFVAEHAQFVDLCKRLGVVFIGPSADVMRKLGDKITSKQIAEEAGVPVAAWSGGAVDTLEAAKSAAERLGYPLMVKATAGGGGRGIRKVRNESELIAGYPAARAEAGGAFGDDAVFLESLVEGARHIEVQIIGDETGTVWPVGVRDCTVQRRNQKIIEEAPSPVLSAEQDAFVKAAAANLGSTAGYTNAGTVEFLYEEETGTFAFMEVNARLQVEHPITELTTGVDLVKLQLHVANGGTLEGSPPQTVGHAIEVRLNAEDPDRGFAPAPGVITMLRLPVGPGVRVDTGVEEGDAIAPEFDSMIAKVMVWGADRHEAIARLRRALDQMRVIIKEGASNKAFVRELIDHPRYLASTINVGWVDALVADPEGRDTRDNAAVAVVAAAIAAHGEQLSVKRRQFRASARRGRPDVDESIGESVQLRYSGVSCALQVHQLDDDTFRISVDGVTIDARVEDLGATGSRLTIGDRTYKVLAAVHGATHYVEVDHVAHRISHDEGGVIRAPSPAVVVSLAVKAGDRVAKGDRLAVIEAMKMETTIVAEITGTVREVLVRENLQVAPGTPLLVLDPEQADEEGSRGAGIDFTELVSPLAGSDHRRCRHYLNDFRRMLLGFDVEPSVISASAEAKERLCDADPDAADVRRLEKEIFAIFADVIALWRRTPSEAAVENERRSSEEYLFDYLRNIAAEGEALPEAFVARLRKTLAHYGVETLQPSSALRAALFRVARSHARMDQQTGPIRSLLEQWLEYGVPLEESVARPLLDAIVDGTRGRYPAIHDLAREVLYRSYDVPFLEQIRSLTFREAAEHLDAVMSAPVGEERSERIVELTSCPQPLSPMILDRAATADSEAMEVLLEVLLRRYYRIRGIEEVTTGAVDGFAFAKAEYDFDDDRLTVVSMFVHYEDLSAAVRALSRLIAEAHDPGQVVVDLFVWRSRQHLGPNETRDELATVLDAEIGAQAIRRVVVVVTGPDHGDSLAGFLNFTMRPDGAGRYEEETLYRDLHPMMAKRLELWRLTNFDIRRLTTLQDIYLFHGTSRDNPRDERLFAFAEVRDLTPIREPDGGVRLPEFERVYHDVLGPIRRFQAHRPAHLRLTWNRVMLYVWPVLEMTPAEITRLVKRLAPETEGLGLQKVSVRVRTREDDGSVRAHIVEISNPTGREVRVRFRDLFDQPIRQLNPFTQKVVRLRQRGLVHPFEIIQMVAPEVSGGRDGFPEGSFVEHDLADGRLVPVERLPGENTCNVVVGIISNKTRKHPDGMRRVAILGDPTRGMGNLAESECSRINAAIDLAEEMGVPVEWYAISAGALIAMDSGTENMDWIGRVLRKIIEFTQGGGELNIVVTGINVGAQPYWNAEATMLMHTKGILVMMPESAMVLTGKQALDYSGGVSAEDNAGIGGYERIMGPNGQAQYFGRDLADACRILLRHYDHSYVAPGERFPRRAETSDPIDRNVEDSPHGGDFAKVGEVFGEHTNPDRKHPFEMRKIMEAVIDRDHRHLERWYGMDDAEVAIIWDAHVGGIPVSVIGFESKPMPRLGFVPADGPDTWTSGTLFPRSSKKIARAINAASGSRPLLVLANLSGFDGSPESMRSWQLEYGAEIGRAVVNFDGPIVFVVVSRYHGGAFVVFSNTLHDNMEVAALEGSKASVIGGAPAAAVVFARDVGKRADADPRVAELAALAAEATGAERARLRAALKEVRAIVYSEKLGEVADEFDAIHSVDRALEVGSIDRIIPPAQLRPYIVDALERGMLRHVEQDGAGD